MTEVRRQRHLNYDWDRPFDPDEFSDNPRAVTMLYEDWLETSVALEDAQKKIQRFRKKATEMDKKHALLIQHRNMARRQRWIVFGLQLLAIVFLGVGINLVTSDPSSIFGWIFLAGGVAIEVAAFVLTRGLGTDN